MTAPEFCCFPARLSLNLFLMGFLFHERTGSVYHTYFYCRGEWRCFSSDEVGFSSMADVVLLSWVLNSTISIP